MQATQAPPRLPGVRASALHRAFAIFYGALFLLVMLPLIVFSTLLAAAQDGHLPWPIAQWALTTPLGALATLALSALIIAPSLILPERTVWRRGYLARAIDVTDLPPWPWPKRPPLRPDETRADRWLGRSRRARIASLALLALAALIALLFFAGFIASAVWTFIQFPNVACGARGCPPQYPLFVIVFASALGVFGLLSLIRSRWLRWVEASSGVWLRYRDWLEAAPLYYIRRPGVTPEAAQAALARLAPAEAMPIARVFATAVLASIPLFLVLLVGTFLSVWLPTQWIPG